MADAPAAAGGSAVVVYVRIGLRCLALLCAIVVMGVSSDQLKGSKYGYDYCVLGMKIYESKSWRQIDHGDDNACNYGIGVGVLTMLAVIAFIVLDILILRGIGAIGNKAFFNVADLVSSSILALRWLVGFIYILDKWDDSGPKDITIRYYFGPSNYDDIFKLDDKESAVGAAIAFCFFGAIIWGVLAFMAAFRLKSAAAA